MPHWVPKMMLIEEGFTEKQIETEFRRETLAQYQEWRSAVQEYRQKSTNNRGRGNVSTNSGSKRGRSVKAKKRTAF